jgi:type VI secretion system ImpC/EvpB family protein
MATAQENKEFSLSPEERAALDPAALTKQLIEGEKANLDKILPNQGEGVSVLLTQVLEGIKNTGKIVKCGLIQEIDKAVAQLDEMVSRQLNAIMHHSDFRRLEGAWRGLKHLVDNSRTGEHLKIRVMNISKADLAKTLDRFTAESGAAGWDQSPIFREVFNKRFDQPGGEPFGCLVGDYQFEASDQDVKLMTRMAKIASAAHAPFLAAAAPDIMGLKSWEQLPDPASLASKMSNDAFAGWRSLRDSEDSRYLALTLPRFMARLPYGANTVPVEGFDFEEDLRPSGDGAGGLCACDKRRTHILRYRLLCADSRGGKWWQGRRAARSYLDKAGWGQGFQVPYRNLDSTAT